MGFQGSLEGLQQLSPSLFNVGQTPATLSAIHSNFLGVADGGVGSAGGGDSMLSMVAMFQAIIGLMTQMIAAGQGGQFLPAGGGFGTPTNGNAGGAIVPSAGGTNGNFGAPMSSNAGGGGGGGGVVPGTGSAAPSSGGVSAGKIGPGTKVLQIGDSHSVGAFGKELDAKLRGTGAQVATYASAGATASTFVDGKSTKYGYWQKGADGQERTVGYGQSAPTPRLDGLIAKEKPGLIVVNLGANFRGGNAKSEVDKLGQVAKKHGIPIIWVGPPKTGKDGSNSSDLAKFDQEMASAVAPYGKYVSSNRHTPKYSGGDGLHYSGSQGTQIAKQWASGVFGEIVG
jgi:hypothetical protein